MCPVGSKTPACDVNCRYSSSEYSDTGTHFGPYDSTNGGACRRGSRGSENVQPCPAMLQMVEEEKGRSAPRTRLRQESPPSCYVRGSFTFFRPIGPAPTAFPHLVQWYHPIRKTRPLHIHPDTFGAVMVGVPGPVPSAMPASCRHGPDPQLAPFTL